MTAADWTKAIWSFPCDFRIVSAGLILGSDRRALRAESHAAEQEDEESIAGGLVEAGVGGGGAAGGRARGNDGDATSSERGGSKSPAKASLEEHLGELYGVHWQKDDDVSECSLCGEAWTFWRRRHHCRSCGRLCCDSCSRARLVPLKGGRERKRACDRCAEERAGEADGGATPPPAEE